MGSCLSNSLSIGMWEERGEPNIFHEIPRNLLPYPVSGVKEVPGAGIVSPVFLAKNLLYLG